MWLDVCSTLTMPMEEKMNRDRLGFWEGLLLGIAFLMVIMVCASCGCAEKPAVKPAPPPVSSVDRASEAVKKQLQDADFDVRIIAAGTIVKMAEVDAAAALPLVEHALGLGDEDVRMTVAWAFGALAREVPEASSVIFNKALGDSSQQVRYHLAYAVRFMPRTNDTGRLLVKLLNDADSQVRFIADESRYFLTRGLR